MSLELCPALESDRARDAIAAALHTLSPRERKILKLRFGFDGKEDQTLQEIGDRMKLTRERVRQLVDRAMEKLAHPARGLRPLLTEHLHC